MGTKPPESRLQIGGLPCPLQNRSVLPWGHGLTRITFAPKDNILGIACAAGLWRFKL